MLRTTFMLAVVAVIAMQFKLYADCDVCTGLMPDPNPPFCLENWTACGDIGPGLCPTFQKSCAVEDAVNGITPVRVIKECKDTGTGNVLIPGSTDCSSHAHCGDAPNGTVCWKQHACYQSILTGGCVNGTYCMQELTAYKVLAYCKTHSDH